ncbi:MAG: hypothetical protein RML94_11775 [Bacteroidia bacterium]|nr:hypothetical protein [Bacteroidia bacterium]
MSEQNTQQQPQPQPQQNPQPSQEQQNLVQESSSEAELEKKMEDLQMSEGEKDKLRKKFQLKVNNKVKELEVDLGNEEEIKKYLQKALAADEKFQEAAQIRKYMESLVTALKTDPIAVLSHPDLGIDVKKLAEMVLAKEIEESQKSPEQKRIEELERKLKEKEEKERMMEEQQRLLELQKLEQEMFDNLDKEISEALKNSSLPKSPYIVKRIADTMLSAIEMGYPDVTVKQILPFVEQQIYSELQNIFDSSPEDILPSLLERFAGKKNLDRYRKSILSKLKAKPVEKPKIEDAGSKEKSSNNLKEKTLDINDLLKFS